MIQTGGWTTRTRKGLALATVILVGWLISMVSLLMVDLSDWPGWLLPVAVLIRTLLQTGLFITAHDAMHGVLVPERRRWNHRLGSFCLGLYGALPYQLCLRNHHRHHHCSATAHDPDFHPDPTAGPLRWYLGFMAGYLNTAQMSRLLSIWGLLAMAFGTFSAGTWQNVLLFCTLPLLLSSIQLFVFGTYLPHRGQRVPEQNRRPASLDHPVWLSLITCFHFGYHREHHEHPELPWFELPRQRRLLRQLTPGLAARVPSL